MAGQQTYNIAMVGAFPFPSPQGTQVAVAQICEALAQRGHNVHLVTYHFSKGSFKESFKIHRILNVPTYKKLRSGPALQKPLLDFLLTLKLEMLIYNWLWTKKK